VAKMVELIKKEFGFDFKEKGSLRIGKLRSKSSDSLRVGLKRVKKKLEKVRISG